MARKVVNYAQEFLIIYCADFPTFCNCLWGFTLTSPTESTSCANTKERDQQIKYKAKVIEKYSMKFATQLYAMFYLFYLCYMRLRFIFTRAL